MAANAEDQRGEAGYATGHATGHRTGRAAGYSARYRVVPVHQAGRGRARLAVSGLYRCDQIKRLLEERLAALAGVREVRANALTGRVLVAFGNELTLEQLCEAIVAALPAETPGLGETLRARVSARASGPGSSPGASGRGFSALSFPVSGALDGLAGGLRGLATGLAALPGALAQLRPSWLSSVPSTPETSSAAVQAIEPWFALELSRVLQRLRQDCAATARTVSRPPRSAAISRSSSVSSTACRSGSWASPRWSPCSPAGCWTPA